MAIVSPPAGRASAVSAARREMRAGGRPARSESRHRATGTSTSVGIGQVALAILERELGRLHGQVHVVGVVERADVEALQQGEDRERGEALRRGREADRLAAAVAEAQRLHPVGAMRGKIVEGQWAAGPARHRRRSGAPARPGRTPPARSGRAGRAWPRARAARSAAPRGDRDGRSATGCAAPERPTRRRRRRGRRRSPAAARATPQTRRARGRRRRRAAPATPRASPSHPDCSACAAAPARHDARHRQRRGAAPHGNGGAEARAIVAEVGRGRRAARWR